MEKSEKQMIEQLKTYIPEERKAELGEILAYGEKMKAEGEIKKQEFWKEHNRDDFLKLLEYKWKRMEEIENKYEYLSGMEGVKKKMFMREYLNDDMLYSGKISEKREEKKRKYGYEDWKNGRVVMKEGETLDLDLKRIGIKGVEAVSNLKLKEGVSLFLRWNDIGDEGAKLIAKNLKLKDGVRLDLSYNKLGADGANFIAENLKLKEGVTLNLIGNEIGAEGAEVISHMELKEGVTLDLSVNEIGDYGAQSIIDNMELKDGVTLDLSENKIGDEIKEKLKKWEKFYHDEGINCEVLV